MTEQKSVKGQSVSPGDLRLTRRRLLQVAGGGAVLASGMAAGASALYRGVAASAPLRRLAGPPPDGYPIGQYQVADYGVRAQPDPNSGVVVNIPPVWNLVITATLTRMPGPGEQRRLEAALQAVEAAYPYSPSGVFALVAYGLPYFRRYVSPAIVAAHMPTMADATGAPVVFDAVRFGSDPPSLVLEANDLVFHFRSDLLGNLHDVQHALFERGGTLADRPSSDANLADLFVVTSVRTGFVGAGLPRRMARQAQLGFADQIPEGAPLFMGFTSSQQLGQASEAAASFDGRPNPLVPPLTTARSGDYFAGGTALHLSHLVEDLESWYKLGYEQRAARMFHYEAVTPTGRITVQTHWLNPNTSAIDAEQKHVIGHNEAVQQGSRTPEGQALQLRVDFNTMDPLDSTGPIPGVHFLSFSPGSLIFQRSRQAMDGVRLAKEYGILAQANGINSFIRATRRQNFLVPPRSHRAFPLLELR